MRKPLRQKLRALSQSKLQDLVMRLHNTMYEPRGKEWDADLWVEMEQQFIRAGLDPDDNKEG